MPLAWGGVAGVAGVEQGHKIPKGIFHRKKRY